MATNLADLPANNYTPIDNGGNTLAAIPTGYQTPQNVLNAIANDAGGVLNKNQARANFLAALHREIAIAKITAYLAAAPAVNANALPNRTVAAAGSLPRVNNNEYQDYLNFIRNSAYNAPQLNAFVVELAGRKQTAHALTQINA